MINSPKDTTTKKADSEFSIWRIVLAWSVHLFTASGAVCGLMALQATTVGDWRTALMWLLLAVIIDAVDGTLARIAQVKQILPNFDGALLDNLIDFLNYVIVPAYLIHRAQLLPESVSLMTASVICIASSYQFCQGDAKTPDHFFTGFPSYWNIVALYLLSLGLAPPVNFATVFICVVAVFVPIKYIYVTRTLQLRWLSYALTAIWAVMASMILWQLPSPDSTLVWASLTYFGYYFAASLYLTLRSQRQAAVLDDEASSS